jgi:hypothetical protein
MASYVVASKWFDVRPHLSILNVRLKFQTECSSGQCSGAGRIASQNLYRKPPFKSLNIPSDASTLQILRTGSRFNVALRIENSLAGEEQLFGIPRVLVGVRIDL